MSLFQMTTMTTSIFSVSNASAKNSTQGGFADMLTAVSSPPALAGDDSLFGEVFDPKTGAIDITKLFATLADRTAQFADRFRKAMADAGVDTSTPITITVAPDGRLVVDPSHPQAALIQKTLDENPALAQAYRNIAAQNDHMACLMVAASYVQAWNGADSDSARQAVFQKFSGILKQVQAQANGQMTISATSITVQSISYVQSMGYGIS